MHVGITIDRMRGTTTSSLSFFTAGNNQVLQRRRMPVLVQILAWLLAKGSTAFSTRARYASIIVQLLMHLLVIRSSQATFHLLGTILVICAWSNWQLLRCQILCMHHKVMAVSVHCTAAFFRCLNHGRQLYHLSAKDRNSIRYGITNLAASNCSTCKILRQISNMARFFDYYLTSIKRLCNTRPVLREKSLLTVFSECW